ncbi:Bromodomain containing protein [Trichomonas vaginalis G3]|uniref:Bromodomain containing protein n=1 Tax=Trichomonas vaginalis (strain ATCC PRA-98 / G3) TaxID=412133 RepID=A2EU48_TRIV3|nr:chromatin organization [Trichomonas vaginalis G3]EAY03796.1 Bromodomain containing protein [Trichomonas vaginalis G3]KAI5552625.1 chromatin organization [Trichomonas vaginalis G3]|eukprot:XP_001316019.1 Bromodomain containing protein [Trichomonas vaginalis G3]
MSLSEAQRLKCLEILDNLRKHPISEMFAKPVDAEADGVPDYYDVIKNPSDFSTVRNKLTTFQYKTFDEFKRDVNLIWENAIQYNTKQSFIALIAEELSRQFQKQLWQFESPPTEQWINDFLRARVTITKLFRNPPTGVANLAFTAN